MFFQFLSIFLIEPINICVLLIAVKCAASLIRIEDGSQEADHDNWSNKFKHQLLSWKVTSKVTPSPFQENVGDSHKGQTFKG